MTINTQKLRDLADSLDANKTPLVVFRAMNEAADHIDAQAAKIARLREIVEMAAAGNTEYDVLQRRARVALSGESNG